MSPPVTTQSKSITSHISDRLRNAPRYLDVYKTDLPPSLVSNVCKYPIHDHLCTTNLDAFYKVVVASISALVEPDSYTEAVKFDAWRLAVKQEIDALKSNGTQTLVELPLNAHVVGCKQVYQNKLRANGFVESFKARLVAKGYIQIEEFDFEETFSPVAKQATVRFFFALASVLNWHFYQVDVNNAFLNGELDEFVYMALPPAYELKREYKDNSHVVYRLHKSLYGLTSIKAMEY